MARILAISSFVAHGTIGLQAMLPVFVTAGLETVALPTVVLSNHPGHPRFAKSDVAASALTSMVDALAAGGWLAGIDAAVTGYLPSRAHVLAARDAIALVKGLNRGLLYVCDPVLGDDPGGLYIEADAAHAIRELLLPLADIITPNRFELAWLGGAEVRDCAGAVDVARGLGVRQTAATSIPDGREHLATLLVEADEAWIGASRRERDVPHGTGDLFAAALTSSLVRGLPAQTALGEALAIVTRAIHDSRGRRELALGGLGERRIGDLSPHAVRPWP